MKHIGMKLFVTWSSVLSSLLLGSRSVVNAQASCETDATYASQNICSSWMLGELACSKFSETSKISVDVIDASIEGNYMKVTASGIPSYKYRMQSSDISFLNNRPKAASDFKTGATTAVSGEQYDFGANIGYTGNQGCAGAGIGFWPPGPGCPSDQEHAHFFPLLPEPATETCFTPLGTMGTFINGVSMFNWGDGTNNNGWYYLAMKMELYDLDVCLGHAANGNYHHHANSPCLEQQLIDNGDKQSPVYAWAADGYPILGPYVSNGKTAKSCWKKRDYSSPSGVGACSVANKRSCKLVDPFDITKGVTSNGVTQGPDTTATVTSQSQNEFVAESGYFFEDYYYDPACTAQGDEYLDKHNGRTDAELGYVYHLTPNDFPYNTGPTFYGKLHSNGIVSSCQTEYVQQGGPGGGGPGGGGGGPPPGGRRQLMKGETDRRLDSSCIGNLNGSNILTLGDSYFSIISCTLLLLAYLL